MCVCVIIVELFFGRHMYTFIYIILNMYVTTCARSNISHVMLRSVWRYIEGAVDAVAAACLTA